MKPCQEYLPIYICHDLHFHPVKSNFSENALTSAHTFCVRLANKVHPMNIIIEYDKSLSEE